MKLGYETTIRDDEIIIQRTTKETKNIKMALAEILNIYKNIHFSVRPNYLQFFGQFISCYDFVNIALIVS